MEHSRVVFNLRECIRIFQNMSEVMCRVWLKQTNKQTNISLGFDTFIELEMSSHLLICLIKAILFVIQRLFFSNELKLLVFGMRRATTS